MKFAEKEWRFWTETLTMTGSALPLVLPRALVFGLFATLVTALELKFDQVVPTVGIEITPFELIGGALSVLLVLRTNAGYERWWEGRRLWGGIVNQSRNLAIASLSYGPDDPAWRDRVVRRASAFGHAARGSLRGDRAPADFIALLGPDEARRVVDAEHMPSAVSLLIGESVRDARDRLGLDGFALLQIDRERAALIDHVGGCERIAKSPLPMAYRIEIRRLLVVFLASLPFALVMRIGWLTPAVTILVAVALLAIDKIGTELQFPFSVDSLNHLPLGEICATIERNLLAMLDGPPAPGPVFHAEGIHKRVPQGRGDGRP